MGKAMYIYVLSVLMIFILFFAIMEMCASYQQQQYLKSFVFESHNNVSARDFRTYSQEQGYVLAIDMVGYGVFAVTQGVFACLDEGECISEGQVLLMCF